MTATEQRKVRDRPSSSQQYCQFVSSCHMTSAVLLCTLSHSLSRYTPRNHRNRGGAAGSGSDGAGFVVAASPQTVTNSMGRLATSRLPPLPHTHIRSLPFASLSYHHHYHHCLTSPFSTSSSQSSTLLPAASLPNYYAMLEADPSTPLSTLKANYYTLALRHHPDRTSHYSPVVKDWSDRRFRVLATAWRTLSDPIRRQQYDTQRLMNAVGDTHRMQHWMKVHRPPEELAPPPSEMAAERTAADTGM